VVVRDVTVADDPAFGGAPFARLAEARVRLRLGALLLLRVEVGDVVLRRPEIALVQQASGRWNVASLGVPPADARRGPRGRGGGGAAAAGAVLVSRVVIEDAVVTVERAAAAATSRYRIEDLDVTAGFQESGRLAFTAEARANPGELDLKIVDGVLALAGTRTLFDAALAGQMMVRSAKLAPVIAATAGPEPEVAGALEGVLTLDGTVGRPRVSGEIALTDVTVSRSAPHCPAPRRRTLRLGPVKVGAAFENLKVRAHPITASLGGGRLLADAWAALDTGRLEVADVVVRTARSSRAGHRPGR
jgi:hypothetical protein